MFRVILKAMKLSSRFFHYCLDDLKIYLTARQIRLDEKEAIRSTG